MFALKQMTDVVLWIVGAGMIAACGAMIAAPEDAATPPANQAKSFMHLKLEQAQKAMEAIALEDFEGISKSAQRIALLTEDENWQVMQTVDYRRHSDDFRRAARLMSECADKKNLDGAVLAYVQMTMQCVHCHKHVRAKREPDR
jgi:hypothetical protein